MRAGRWSGARTAEGLLLNDAAARFKRGQNDQGVYRSHMRSNTSVGVTPRRTASRLNLPFLSE
jgi:hypothetical protein